jgi:hypothetical protein
MIKVETAVYYSPATETVLRVISVDGNCASIQRAGKSDLSVFTHSFSVTSGLLYREVNAWRTNLSWSPKIERIDTLQLLMLLIDDEFVKHLHEYKTALLSVTDQRPCTVARSCFADAVALIENLQADSRGEPCDRWACHDHFAMMSRLLGHHLNVVFEIRKRGADESPY